jgi:methyl-accepting chemotaxis protein
MDQRVQVRRGLTDKPFISYQNSLLHAWIAAPSGTVMSLRNMNIAPRAFLGFSIIGLLMLVLGIFALTQMSKINDATETMATNSMPSIKALDKLTEASIRLRVLSYRLMLNRDPDTLQKTVDLLAMRNKQIEDARAIYVKLISAPEEQAAYDQYLSLLNDYRRMEDRMKSLSSANKLDELTTMLSADLQTNSDQMNVVLGKLVEINTQQLNDTNKMASTQYSSAITMVVTLLIVATALTLLFAWLLTNSITRPIASASKLLRKWPKAT